VRHTLWVIRDRRHAGATDRTVRRHAGACTSPTVITVPPPPAASAPRAVPANPAHTGNEAYNYFLSVIFPHHQMRILDYNRVIKDMNGLSEAEFMARVAESFMIEMAGAQSSRRIRASSACT
jgi:hypothetical protein